MDQSNFNQNEFQESNTTGASDVPPAEHTTAPKKSKKGLLIAIISIIVVAILAVAGFFVYNALTKKDTAAGKVDELPPGEVSEIALYPDCEVKKSDLEKFGKLIEERAAVLGTNYKVVVDKEKIVLTIEKSLLGNTAAERVGTIELLTSRGNINIGEKELIGYDSPEKKNFSNITITEFDRADLLSDYKVNMKDERYDQLDAIKEEKIYGIDIELDKDGKKLVKETVDSSYDESPKLTMIHDFLEDDPSKTKFFGSVFVDDEKKPTKITVINPGASYEKNAHLMKKVLEQGQLDFGLVVQIMDEPTWETEGKHLGKNQASKLGGESFVIQCEPDKYTRTYLSEVEFAEYEKIVKNRLDKLDVKYMFGTTGFDDKTYCVKLNSKEIAPDFIRLIFNTNGISVVSAFDNISSLTDLEVVKDGNKLALRASMYDSAEEFLTKYQISDDTVYLVANDVTIASANINNLQSIDDSKCYIDFDTFLCFDEPEATQKEENILRLIEYIYNDEDRVYFVGTYTFISDSSKNLTLSDLKWKYSSMSAVDDMTFALLEDECYTISKMVDSRNMLIIELDIPVNDDLPVAFTDKVKELYNMANFDDGSYVEIHFVIKDETKESPANQLRIEVTKDTYNGKMNIRHDASGPKFFEYWGDMYDILITDPFYSTHRY